MTPRGAGGCGAACPARGRRGARGAGRRRRRAATRGARCAESTSVCAPCGAVERWPWPPLAGSRGARSPPAREHGLRGEERPWRGLPRDARTLTRTRRRGARPARAAARGRPAAAAGAEGALLPGARALQPPRGLHAARHLGVGGGRRGGGSGRAGTPHGLEGAVGLVLLWLGCFWFFLRLAGRRGGGSDLAHRYFRGLLPPSLGCQERRRLDRAGDSLGVPLRPPGGAVARRGGAGVCKCCALAFSPTPACFQAAGAGPCRPAATVNRAWMLFT